MLVLGFEGDEDVVAARSAAVAPWVSAAEDLGAEPGERWYAHRHNVSYKLAPIFLRNGFADTMEVAASWSCFEALQKQVRAAIGRRAVVMAHMSHAYPEGCSIYFSFAGKGSLRTYDALWKDALAAAIDAGGTCTHHHGVGLLKAKAARREVGHAYRVFERRKSQLDPGGVMNPGRVYAGEAPADRGPAPPEGEGPVWGIAAESLIASVDPRAAPVDVQSTLQQAGYRMRVLPDRPLGAWLRDWRPQAHPVWAFPLIGVQARFADGVSAFVGGPPRSAAGPDLRFGLLWDAEAERVDVPIVPLGETISVQTAQPKAAAALDLRPAWTEAQGGDAVLTFDGPTAGAFVELVTARCAGKRLDTPSDQPMCTAGEGDR